ncbi:hypothetical protein C0995_000656 [Termitomyces sp. Mi166|nr:hypothetical protein C0995_000656 [Termitomyces sp. Mi166\
MTFLIQRRAAPFNGTVDQDLSIAYISAFILIFMELWACVDLLEITLFPLGGSRLIAMDFVGPDVEPEEVKEAVRRRRQAFFLVMPNVISRLTKRHGFNTTEKITDLTDAEKSVQPAQDPSNAQTNTCESRPDSQCLSMAIAPSTGRQVTFQGDFTSTGGTCLLVDSSTPTEAGFCPSVGASQEPTVIGGEIAILGHKATKHDHLPIANTESVESSSNMSSSSTQLAASTVFRRNLRFLRSFALTLLTPASITILLSFPIALIPPLKGLFTPLPASNSTSTFANPHIHPAPDGLPPLSIVLDTATFIGAASIPLGLICLGSALARLKIPRNQWSTLPTGSITSLAIGKMVITPILGVGIVEGLVKGGIISADDKLLQFLLFMFTDRDDPGIPHAGL